jgi:hypothetical protein
MIPPWVYLDDQDRTMFRATVVFLDNRLAEQGTIDWALRLKPSQRIERIAIDDLLNTPRGRVVAEPWATAWRLIEESWSASAIEEGPSTAIYGIQERLNAGDSSGSIVSAIVNLVAPRLKVESKNSGLWRHVKKPRRPKTFDHLLSVRLSSGNLVDLDVLRLRDITDVRFLKALANALESAVSYGLDIWRRLGLEGQMRLSKLSDLRRVYYVGSAQGTDESRDPDAFHRGIAPSVKLLHAVVARIADVEPKDALPFFQSWRLLHSQIHIRLWAAAARNSQLIAAEEVTTFFLGLNDRQFWDLHVFPEIAELRALRFGGFDLETRKAIVTRLRKGPPRDHWPKNADAQKVKNARLYWAVRELKRIEVAGGDLPPDARTWLEAMIGQFPDLAAMGIDDGFPKGLTTRSVPRNPDARYDTLIGVERLRALEAALSASRGGWDDDPAERANDWLMQPEKTALVLSDLEVGGNGGDDFPRVWNRFGWAHSPRSEESANTTPRDLQIDAERVLRLLNQLSEAALRSAIEGISAWLAAWEKYVIASPLLLPVWLRVWPIAVAATNIRPESDDDTDLSVSERKPIELDTLNTPAGKLVGVFLAGCPRIAPGSQAFTVGSVERKMRDAVIASTGQSGLIARHRLIESLHYFLQADQFWAEQHLVQPLNDDNDEANALWMAVARGISQPPKNIVEILRLIGVRMVEKANDLRLNRDTRRVLVFRLVVESLHAYHEKRDPAVSNPQIQQMLRTLDDEVRGSAAGAIQQFVRELSARPSNDGRSEGKEQQDTASAALLFYSAAAPFLREVWPQERPLVTPGVSRALADLPATSGDAFAEAVEAIARFLVPFDCWSMIEYGLYGDDGETKKLSIINDETKARAFLRLLDLTIGSSEGAIIPHDLTDALDQIRSVAPVLVDSPAFRRLSTAARR